MRHIWVAVWKACIATIDCCEASGIIEKMWESTWVVLMWDQLDRLSNAPLRGDCFACLPQSVGILARATIVAQAIIGLAMITGPPCLQCGPL